MIIDVMHSGVSKCLAGALLISGVYDLAPVAQSYVNDLALDAERDRGFVASALR